MALVILIDTPRLMDSYIEEDMRRWWGQRCKKHIQNDEIYFEVGPPRKFRIYEGIKRLASFGIMARAAYRKC